jgi:hypothetical protein
MIIMILIYLIIIYRLNIMKLGKLQANIYKMGKQLSNLLTNAKLNQQMNV